MSLAASRRENPDTTVAMRDVAGRIGTELAELAAALHNVQMLISPLLHDAAKTNPIHLHELQDLDHIHQKVGNLAEFLAALSLNLPKQWVLDASTASQVITLSALASRLGLTTDLGFEDEQPAGDCEFF